MGKLDIRHKETIRLFPGEFFELFFPDLVSQLCFETAQYLDKELNDIFGEKDREGCVDALFSIERKNDGRWESSILHWEQQGKRDTNMGERMYHYSCGIYFRYRKPVLSVALFTDQAVWRKPVKNTFEIFWGKKPSIKSRFRLIKLKDYTAKEFVHMAPDNPLVWAYLPFTSYKPEEKFDIVIQALQGVLKTVQPGVELATLVSLIEQSVPLNDAEFKEFRSILAKELQFSEVNMLQSIKEVGFESGFEKGIKQGIDKGIAEGFDKGIAEGFDKGIAEGFDKGIEQGFENGERQTTLWHVKAFLDNGVAWDVITNAMGITSEDYQEILKSGPK